MREVQKSRWFIERSILNAVGFIQATVSNDETRPDMVFTGRDRVSKASACCPGLLRSGSKSVIALSGFYLTGIILALYPL